MLYYLLLQMFELIVANPGPSVAAPPAPLKVNTNKKPIIKQGHVWVW